MTAEEADHLESMPRVLAPEEIDLYLKGDRREIDRLILLSLNRLAQAFTPHAQQEVQLMQDIAKLGGMEIIARRAAWIDVQMRKATAQAEFWEGLCVKLKYGGIGIAISCLGILMIYYWNSHVPASMQIIHPLIPKLL